MFAAERILFPQIQIAYFTYIFIKYLVEVTIYTEAKIFNIAR